MPKVSVLIEGTARYASGAEQVEASGDTAGPSVLLAEGLDELLNVQAGLRHLLLVPGGAGGFAFASLSGFAYAIGEVAAFVLYGDRPSFGFLNEVMLMAAVVLKSW